MTKFLDESLETALNSAVVAASDMKASGDYLLACAQECRAKKMAFTLPIAEGEGLHVILSNAAVALDSAIALIEKLRRKYENTDPIRETAPR